MGVTVAEILDEADRLLEAGVFEDYCLNGLQVPGEHEVELIVTGVSAHAELFARAADAGAQLVLVHHGLFWGSGVRAIDPLLRARLKLLLDAGIALAAYHLPLDAHPEIGNNALIARALGAGSLEPFAAHGARTIGFVASLGDEGRPIETLIAEIGELTGREPLRLGRGPAHLHRLAIVSGGGSDYLHEAARAGAEGLLTGEPNERVTALANELGMHLIAAGHYATETFGVRRLGEHLAERFGLEHLFVDIPNPV